MQLKEGPISEILHRLQQSQFYGSLELKFEAGRESLVETADLLCRFAGRGVP